MPRCKSASKLRYVSLGVALYWGQVCDSREQKIRQSSLRRLRQSNRS
ncbi:Uncharacterised protein [Vibrio cholerae]|nr:Uncharacterised protein [Vibrio cholerae]